MNHLRDTFDQRKIPPAGNMRRQSDALMCEIDRSAETDTATVTFRPVADDARDFRQHPLWTSLAIRDMGRAMRHAAAVEERDGKLRSADVNRQRVAHPCSSSVGLTVPVPFFMMVCDATR